MKVDYSTLKEFGIKVMVSAGLDQEEADIFVQSLLFADARGIGSHGMSRLVNYSKRVACGVITPHADIKVLKEGPATLAVDGCNGIGAKIAMQTMKKCIEKAKAAGCCVAAVKNGNHFGAGAFYSGYAAQQGMIAYVASNSEAAVVPIGGAVPMLGTNPMSIAVPSKRHRDFNLDMATSVVARGKVVLAQKEGHAIPEGWAVDKNGAPTTDPDAVMDGGSMLPFGGPKGYAISLFIDLMASALGGSLNGRNTSHFWTDYENPQNIGYFMVVIDPSAFLPEEEFLSRTDDIFDEFKNCPTAPGVREVMIPGEIEGMRQETAMKEGIELSEAVVQELRKVGEKYGVDAGF